jgi:hypothetical protein
MSRPELQVLAGAADAAPIHSAPVTSIVSDLDSYFEEIETLLRRAKNIVRDPALHSRPAPSLADHD